MGYFNELRKEFDLLIAWLDVKKEEGADVLPLEKRIREAMAKLRGEAEKLPIDPEMDRREPVGLEDIKALRPRGPRTMPLDLSDEALQDRLLGAWLGRAAGCVLGIPCEGMSKSAIKQSADALGCKYPLEDYWPLDPRPHNSHNRHYGLTPRKFFLKPNMSFVGTDDDLTYTLLGLLILEEYGLDFTAEDVGKAWLKYLPMACTAEHVALENLKKGLKPPKTALTDNPYWEWIGADIRSDPWGYAAPGLPEKAAEMAYRDASVSHIKNGTYGEMFFSAAIAAAFVVDDPIEAIRIGLTEIPAECRTAKAVRETLRWCASDRSWDKTTDRILKKYEGMSMAHTINNAALTVAGLYYGRGDFGKTIALTVMGGVDTDCTGATAGSIMGAILGAKRLPAKWRDPLGGYAETYMKGKRRFRHMDVAKRFLRIAREARGRWGGAAGTVLSGRDWRRAGG
ncbi:MAG: ADP-ribosylglycohydrolase family protein [Planctomycetota bacterium]|nr:ADP-ribosylglycohydrolase family protein [Planctomycetota bacterium]